MRPLSSVFGLRLQTAVKIICKSFLVLVTITLTLNLYNIDYQGPRRESGIALGLVLLFFALMTGSGFAGHSGANRESLVLVVLSLCFLIVAILHWLALGIMSMQKSDPQTMWRVCIQNRCAETLWSMDFGYRITFPNNEEAVLLLKRRQMPRPYTSKMKSVLTNYSENRRTHRSVISTNLFGHYTEPAQRRAKRLTEPKDYEEIEEVEEMETNAVIHKPVDFWQRFTERDYESSDPSTGVSLVVTLICFLLVFAYFVGCVTIICSYSSEMYDEDRFGDFEEEEGKEEESIENNENAD